MLRELAVAAAVSTLLFGAACTSGASSTSTPSATLPLPGPSGGTHPPTRAAGLPPSPSPVPSDGFVRMYPNPFMGGPPSKPSGVTGAVYGGPACEFSRPACAQQLVHLRGTITASSRSGGALGAVSTDRTGHYLIALGPGVVTLRFELGSSFGAFSCPPGPISVTIPAGRYVGVDFVCIEHAG